MSTFILTWNPAISEYKMSQFHSDLKIINDGDTADLYWPVEEHEDCYEGDRFFMIRTGRGHTGICMAGYFHSDSFEDDEYQGPKKRYVVGIDPLVLVNTDETEYISIDALKEVLPSIDWEHIECGTMISEEEAGILEDYFLRYLYKHQDMYNGYKAAKSWNFDLEDFESIPEHLQEYYKDNIGCTCEKCGRHEDEVDEMAYHLVLDGDTAAKAPYDSHLHCYCSECWFGKEENM